MHIPRLLTLDRRQCRGRAATTSVGVGSAGVGRGLGCDGGGGGASADQSISGIIAHSGKSVGAGATKAAFGAAANEGAPNPGEEKKYIFLPLWRRSQVFFKGGENE